MIEAGTLAWFARHETRLAWRDWAWLLSGGRRRRGYMVALGVAAFAVFAHGFAYVALVRAADFGAPPDKRLVVAVGGALLLYWSLMLSQAMEAVTRAFYARGDLDLILSSSASAERLFAVRIGAMALSIAAMSLARCRAWTTSISVAIRIDRSGRLTQPPSPPRRSRRRARG